MTRTACVSLTSSGRQRPEVCLPEDRPDPARVPVAVVVPTFCTPVPFGVSRAGPIRKICTGVREGLSPSSTPQIIPAAEGAGDFGGNTSSDGCRKFPSNFFAQRGPDLCLRTFALVNSPKFGGTEIPRNCTQGTEFCGCRNHPPPPPRCSHSRCHIQCSTCSARLEDAPSLRISHRFPAARSFIAIPRLLLRRFDKAGPRVFWGVVAA